MILLFKNKLTMSLTKFDLITICVIIILLTICIYQHYQNRPLKKTETSVLGIKNLIEEVRSELISVQKTQEGETNKNIFQLNYFDLEIKFVVNETKTASGKVAFEVVTIGGENTISNERVQTIKLHMTTIQPESGEIGPAE